MNGENRQMVENGGKDNINTEKLGMFFPLPSIFTKGFQEPYPCCHY